MITQIKGFYISEKDVKAIKFFLNEAIKMLDVANKDDNESAIPDTHTQAKYNIENAKILLNEI